MSAVNSVYNVEDQRRMSPAKNYFAWQNRIVTRELGARIIEVGCGIGNFTATILDRDAVMGVDVDANCISRFRRRFEHFSNLQSRLCDVSSDEFLAVREFGADSCVALNVLEHIEDDHGALANMKSVVRQGGIIVLLVPAFPSLYGPIDRNLGHCRRYTRGSIRVMAKSLNLEIVKLDFVNFVGFFGWWLNAQVLGLEAQSERQIGLFDRCVVPVMSRMERWVHPPLGQSLLAVLRVP